MISNSSSILSNFTTDESVEALLLKFKVSVVTFPVAACTLVVNTIIDIAIIMLDIVVFFIFISFPFVSYKSD